VSEFRKITEDFFENEKEGYFYPLILTNPMDVVYENE